MKAINRRRLLALLGSAGAVGLAGIPDLSWAQAASPQDFDFIFFTDTHLQPELDANRGCAMAFRKMRTLHADFAIQGGDHIFDALRVPPQRSLSLFQLYDQTQQELGLPIYHTLGNHDCFGIYPESGMQPADPLYGKRYYQEHVGKTYYSFDHKGVHFIVLDSIGFTPDRAYEGRIDAAQLSWLASDLKASRPPGPSSSVCTSRWSVRSTTIPLCRPRRRRIMATRSRTPPRSPASSPHTTCLQCSRATPT